MTRPSLADFGTHDESAYPELWHNVIGSWCPSLGPTGSRLHDFSRRNNWGTFVNIGPDRWIVQDGMYSLNFVSSNDQYVQVISDQSQLRLHPRAFWLSAWARPTSQGTNVGREIFSKLVSESPFISYGLDWGGSGTANRWRFNLGVTGPSLRLMESTSTYQLNEWYHVAGVYDGVNQSLYVNGNLAAQRSETADVFYDGNSIGIGRWLGDSAQEESFAGQISQITLRNGVPSQGAVKLEYDLGRGGMYTRRTRRSVYIPVGFNASWARNSNVLLGAGATC